MVTKMHFERKKASIYLSDRLSEEEQAFLSALVAGIVVASKMEDLEGFEWWERTLRCYDYCII